MKGPIQMVKITAYTSPYPQNNDQLKGPRNRIFQPPIWIIPAQNKQNLQAPGLVASPMSHPLPNIISFSHFQLYRFSPASPGSLASSLFSPGAQISPAVTISSTLPPNPPPIWLHLLPWLGAHTKPGVILRAPGQG